MAKLSGLIPILAELLALPEKSVAMYARHLREARLITTGGRGLGGAKMSPKDCSNLLIAIMGGNYAKDAAKTVRKYRRITPRADHTIWQLDRLDLPGLKTLPARHHFGRAFDRLFSAAANGTLEPALMDAGDKDDVARINVPASLAVGLKGPLPVARIAFQSCEWGEDITYAEALPWRDEYTPSHEEFMRWNEELERKYVRGRDYGDLTQERWITTRTILALGDHLRA